MQVGWLVVLRINVDLAIFQPYLDLEAGDNQYLKIQVARPGIEPRSSCSAQCKQNTICICMYQMQEGFFLCDSYKVNFCSTLTVGKNGFEKYMYRTPFL